MKKISIMIVFVLAFSLLLAACGESPELSATEAPVVNDALAPMQDSTVITDEEKASIETIVTAVGTNIVGFVGEYSYEGWKLPASTTWDDVINYYDAQAVDANWTPDAGLSGEIADVPGAQYAAFAKEDGSMVVILYIPDVENVFVITLAGFVK
jgi:hypothetical protein